MVYSSLTLVRRVFGSSLKCFGLEIRFVDSIATRFLYFVGFLVNLVVNVVALNFGHTFANDTKDGDCTKPGCFNRIAVFRICFASFIFHSVLGLVLVGVKSSTHTRSAIQNEWWIFKVFLWLGLLLLCLHIPLHVVLSFADVSLVASGLFIVMQSILLIDFTYRWNDRWAQFEMHSKILLMSAAIFIANLVMIIVMFVFFSGPSCVENTFFITISLIEWLAFAVISIYVNRGILPGNFMGLFCICICFGAIMSEPFKKNMHQCNKLGVDNSGFATAMITFMCTLSLAYSTVKIATSADISADPDDEDQWSMETSMEQEDEKKATHYSYSYFHLLYTMGSVFLSMALTNWDLSVTDGDDNGSWVGSWVSMISQWISAVIFVWALLAPVYSARS